MKVTRILHAKREHIRKFNLGRKKTEPTTG